MGSIQAFPRKPAAATLADVWRSASVSGSGAIQVCPARLEDYAALRALQRRAMPWRDPETLRQLESRRLAFSAGQLVAVCDGHLVGAANSLVVSWDAQSPGATWNGVTGEGFYTSHDPQASSLYVASLHVDAGERGPAVARALLQAERRLCRRMNLRRIVTTPRLEGFRDAAQGITPERYVMRVVWGDIPDATMRLQMSLGFQHCGVLHGYAPEDADSGGHAALFAWLNPMHSPPRPPAFVASVRPRKVA